MPILPPKAAPSKHWKRCDRCNGRDVIPAQRSDGKQLLAEWCPKGKGTLGLVAPLIAGSPLLAVDSGGTNYREHRCPGALQAHSAGSFGGKKAAPSARNPEYFLSDIRAPKRAGRK